MTEMHFFFLFLNYVDFALHQKYLLILDIVVVVVHTSKINVLRSSLDSEEMLQNYLYLHKKKTQVVFFVFHFKQLSFFPL